MGIMNFTSARNMIADVWILYKKYAAKKLTKQEVVTFTQDAQEIYKKYKTPFTRDIVLAVIEEINRTVNFMQKG